MTDARLEPLTPETCVNRLRERTVGRLAIVIAGDPIILPVNYRLVEPASGPLLTIRTRPGNVVDHSPASVAFEIDSIDSVHHRGWSVLVRGELLHATPTSAEFRERYDSDSWLDDREAWLLIDPWAISGRELHGTEPSWPVHPSEYM
jgi:nitroimidazol reductase NimA-like FMN-containing flavoprotein (pyridoxamine 5'-phosphate oxidase superfamily)